MPYCKKCLDTGVILVWNGSKIQPWGPETIPCTHCKINERQMIDKDSSIIKKNLTQKDTIV